MKKILTIAMAGLLIFLAGDVVAQGGAVPGSGFSNSIGGFQAYTPTFDRLYAGQASSYWPIINNLRNDQCEAASDFVVAIPPGGCSPSVVRSDLLEEQNVPVFCQLYSIQTNPLIQVSSIRSISFRGQYPEGVSSISFHPARAAARSYRTLTGDPLINNIGYVVIILKRERIEENMEDWIAGNLTATIRYDAEKAFGVGRSEFYLPVIGESKWEEEYKRSSFWGGRGYLRAEEVGGDRARIQILAGKDRPLSTVDLKTGETSILSYLPGYYCRAGLRVRLNNIVAMEDQALLNIDGTHVWVRSGSRILNNQCSVRSLRAEKNGTGELQISCAGTRTFTLRLGDGNTTKRKTNLSSELEKYYSLAENETLKLVKTFEQVQKDGNIGTFAEEALFKHIAVAKALGKATAYDKLTKLYLETYADSPRADWVRTERDLYGLYDYSQAYKGVFVASKFRQIGIREFKAVDEKKRRASFRMGTQPINNVGENFSANFNEGTLRVNRILPQEVEFSFDPRKSNIGATTIRIRQGETKKVGTGDITVQSVNVEEVAHVSLIPEVQQTWTDANFTFKIGIEKRSIQLSPNKSQERLENIEESIQKWEEINERLGDLVKGWKGACFATSAFLMAKNVLSGFDGTALARQKVMKRYRTICAQLPYNKMTQIQCFNNLSTEIDATVNKMAKSMGEINKDTDDLLNSGKHKVAGGVLSDGTVVDQEALVKDMRTNIDEEWWITIDGQNITRDDLQTSSQVNAVLLAQKLKGQGVAGDVAEIEMNQTLRAAAARKRQLSATQGAKDRVGALFETQGDLGFISLRQNGTEVLYWQGKEKKDLKPKGIGDKVPDNAKMQGVNIDGTDYLFVLKESTGSTPVAGIDATYKKEGNTWVLVEKSPINAVFDIRESKGQCSYAWPAGTAEVRYYESGANKGNPAIVPFDLENGYYVMISDSNGDLFSSSPKGYTQSGIAKYFRICSIGPNRIMEVGTHDDQCQTFSDNTANTIDTLQFCRSMTKSDVQRLYNRAVQAIRQAAAQYGDGKSVSIFDRIVRVGEPLTNLGGLECHDFMSPDECKLMFNVCDPVICPPSRCDMGGKNPVSDVIQTGIIGSIAQCLPNAREGIYVPVCVSGIHAGLDTYTTLLKSERDCLNRSIETGELVGICDEMMSVYKCEFFWKQATPLMNSLIPKLFTGFTGSRQNVRGGGEYLFAKTAWDNLDKSISYFKDNYAQNAFRAFNLRNVEEAGSTFCRSFIGTSLPTSADAIDSLLEPESPPQFYAKFSEIAFSEATVPATSQYKVYYHIYAGNDRSVQYRVYLQDPPASGYYASAPRVHVKTGFLAKGTTADEAIDFTAPEGYKTLCVEISGQEPKCGFKQVTSDFGIDYVSSKFVEEQATQTDITTESECISGSPSFLPLVQPNLQSGIEEGLKPDISLRGIVRVCAHQNPASTLNSSRWKDVGHCGEQDFRCWLDLESVKKDLKKVAAIENKTISILDKEKKVIINNQRSHEEAAELLQKAREAMGTFNKNKETEIIHILEKVTGNIDKNLLPKGSNRDRAEATELKVAVYHAIIKAIREQNTPPSTNTPRENTDTDTNTPTPRSPTSTEGSALQMSLIQSKQNAIVRSSTTGEYYAVVYLDLVSEGIFAGELESLTTGTKVAIGGTAKQILTNYGPVLKTSGDYFGIVYLDLIRDDVFAGELESLTTGTKAALGGNAEQIRTKHSIATIEDKEALTQKIPSSGAKITLQVQGDLHYIVIDGTVTDFYLDIPRPGTIAYTLKEDVLLVDPTIGTYNIATKQWKGLGSYLQAHLQNTKIQYNFDTDSYEIEGQEKQKEKTEPKTLLEDVEIGDILNKLEAPGPEGKYYTVENIVNKTIVILEGGTLIEKEGILITFLFTRPTEAQILGQPKETLQKYKWKYESKSELHIGGTPRPSPNNK